MKYKSTNLLFSGNIGSTAKLDKILLHKYLGLPIFLAMIYLAFFFTMQVGGDLQAIFEKNLDIILIRWPLQFCMSIDLLPALRDPLILGLGQGLKTTLCFIPVITSMFLCVTFLEASGYMARVACLMDKIMHSIGLSGRAFIPMMMGFGCNVPAVLGARTLADPRERIKTILMTPFMSCGARLSVYALFVAAFFQRHGSLIIFGLYIFGIVMGFLTGKLFGGRTCKHGSESLGLLGTALPPFQWPSMRFLWKTTFRRSRNFIVKVGIVILPVCLLFGILNTAKMSNQETYLMHIGRAITPIFTPMGIEKENWPATVGLMTGVLAKEVVVGTLTTLYVEEAKALPDQALGALGMMAMRFGSQISALAYLLFVLLYFPCISVLVAITRELNIYWALFSGFWTTGLAYFVAVVFYQGATFVDHPLSSGAWILGLSIVMVLGIIMMRRWVSGALLAKNKPFPTRMMVTT